MGLDTLAASKYITTSARDVVKSWEKGELLPTWSQISKLSKLYNVSELLFFSKETLTRDKQIPDYRVGANHENDGKIKKLN